MLFPVLKRQDQGLALGYVGVRVVEVCSSSPPEMFDYDLATALQALLAAPIGLNEMVLAGWLILRGFDTSARAPAPREPAWEPV
ncbi:MAG TPA: hypothetical protein VK894_04100 [Jiangellales bacterium]|nr:hypothetical protein [Jiangellales bacterium]